jgi:hypothetical protein
VGADERAGQVLPALAQVQRRGSPALSKPALLQPAAAWEPWLALVEPQAREGRDDFGAPLVSDSALPEPWEWEPRRCFGERPASQSVVAELQVLPVWLAGLGQPVRAQRDLRAVPA